jgi:hypothetical protein
VLLLPGGRCRRAAANPQTSFKFKLGGGVKGPWGRAEALKQHTQHNQMSVRVRLLSTKVRLGSCHNSLDLKFENLNERHSRATFFELRTGERWNQKKGCYDFLKQLHVACIPLGHFGLTMPTTRGV